MNSPQACSSAYRLSPPRDRLQAFEQRGLAFLKSEELSDVMRPSIRIDGNAYGVTTMMIRIWAIPALLAAVLFFLSGCYSEAMAQAFGGEMSDEAQERMKTQQTKLTPAGTPEAELRAHEKASEAAAEKMEQKNEGMEEKLEELEPQQRRERVQEIREERQEIQERKLEKYRQKERKAFFDDIDGDVAVFARFPDDSQSGALQEDGYYVEFCYAESGCEDRSDQDGQVLFGDGKGLIHASDPDKEVVGLKLRYKMKTGSSRAIVSEGTHTPDESSRSDRFDVDERLITTESYSQGEPISYELGRTDE